MAILPSYWGEGLWRTMYSVAYNYPDKPTINQRKSLVSFFNSFKELLPCDECRKHYIRMLKESPITNVSSNRSSVLGWVNKIHNDVNKKNGRTQVPLAKVVEEIKRYEVNNDVISEESKKALSKTPLPKPKVANSLDLTPVNKSKKTTSQAHNFNYYGKNWNLDLLNSNNTKTNMPILSKTTSNRTSSVTNKNAPILSKNTIKNTSTNTNINSTNLNQSRSSFSYNNITKPKSKSGCGCGR